MNPAWARAIASIESSGRYNLLGPTTGSGDRAYGKYQVMGNNVPEWTQAALGRRMTPDEFLNDSDAQEKVFSHRFGGYVDKYGSPQEAASRWFTGRSMAEGANKRDVLGTTGAGYVGKFNKALGQSGPEAINAAIGQPNNEGEGSAMAFANNSNDAPVGFLSGGPGAWFGLPNGKTSGGYDVGEAIMGAGAGLQSIDNPRGATSTAQLLAASRKEAQKQQKDGDFAYDAKSGTFYRTRANGMLETSKNPNKAEDDDKPKMTEKALTNVSENLEKYDYVTQTSKAAADVYEDIQNGKLDLGLFKNWINSGKNMAGVSSEQSRAFAKWEQFRQRLANDELRLNKGVQTEGDAYREMKSFVAGGAGYDNQTASDSLKRIIQKGQDAVTNRGRVVLDAHRGLYGDEPFKTYTTQADRWNETYSDINKRLERYSNPPQNPTAAPAAKSGGGFKVIKSPY